MQKLYFQIDTPNGPLDELIEAMEAIDRYDVSGSGYDGDYIDDDYPEEYDMNSVVQLMYTKI